MKKLILSASLLFIWMGADAQQLQIPKPSPAQTIRQDFGIGSISVAYSRPGLKERRVGTDFIPYGQLWRTGANGATTITFTDDVTFGGTKVPKGTYGLLTIPDAREWVVILSADLNVNLAPMYKPEHDVARFTASVKSLNIPVETFTLNFSSFTLNSCLLQISWDNSLLEVPIETDVDTKIAGQIENIFEGDTKPYYEAAQYYFDTGRDIKQATEWIEKATEGGKNANMLHMFWLKAQIYQKSGNKVMAKKAAEVLIEKAGRLGNQDYVSKSQHLMKQL